LTLSECLLEASHGRIAVVLADTWRHLVRPWRVTCSILSGSRTRLSSPTPPATTSRGSPRRSADRSGCLPARGRPRQLDAHDPTRRSGIEGIGSSMTDRGGGRDRGL